MKLNSLFARGRRTFYVLHLSDGPRVEAHSSNYVV